MTDSEDFPRIVPPVDTPPGQTGVPGAVNPAALTIAQLARMLAVPEETIRRHVAAGAPASADGHVNLVHYAAWLNKEMASSGENDGD